MEVMNGFTVTEIGIGLILVALLYLIMKIGKIAGALEGGESKSAAAPAVASAPAAAPAAQDNTELIAVITAAVAAVLDAEGAAQGQAPGSSKFVVRTIRRVHNSPAWNRAGREEQIYSRM